MAYARDIGNNLSLVELRLKAISGLITTALKPQMLGGNRKSYVLKKTCL